MNHHPMKIFLALSLLAACGHSDGGIRELGCGEQVALCAAQTTASGFDGCVNADPCTPNLGLGPQVGPDSSLGDRYEAYFEVAREIGGEAHPDMTGMPLAFGACEELAVCIEDAFVQAEWGSLTPGDTNEFDGTSFIGPCAGQSPCDFVFEFSHNGTDEGIVDAYKDLIVSVGREIETAEQNG